MQPETNLTSHQPKLLIPRPQRRRFALLFTLMTALGLFIGFWVSRGLFNLPIFRQLIAGIQQGSTFPTNSSILTWVLLKSTENILVYTSVGIGQWLILRRYVQSWWWIVATTAGWVFISVISLELIAAVLPVGYTIALWWGIPLAIISYICLGFAQRFVLMHYVVSAWKWIFIPLVCQIIVVIISIPIIFLILGPRVQVAPFIRTLISFVIQVFSFGFIQALVLCTFRQKQSNEQLAINN